MIARVSFWISLVLGVEGLFITFFPGCEFQWFAFTAVLAVAGLLIPKWSYRVASLLMVVLWSVMSFNGYSRGKEYQLWLKENPPEKRVLELEEMLRKIDPNNPK